MPGVDVWLRLLTGHSLSGGAGMESPASIDPFQAAEDSSIGFLAAKLLVREYHSLPLLAPEMFCLSSESIV
jgi:hypothetical protein